MELIDRSLLKAMICNLHCALGETNRLYLALNEVLRCVDTIPTIDPVKHGRWIATKALTGIDPVTLDVNLVDADRCSICSTDFVSVLVKYKYCPNCGARMDLPSEREVSE